MKRTILAIALSVACASAFATNNKPANPCGNHGNNCTQPVSGGAGGSAVAGAASVAAANASSRNNIRVGVDSDNRSSASAAGGSANATNGSVTGNLGAVSSSGASQASNGNQSLTVNNVEASDIRIRNTPSVSAWAAAPSATCVVTTGGAVNVPGFGGGLSTGTIDKGCEARENARFLASMGAQVEAVRVLCRAQADVAAEVEQCKDIHEEHVKRANDRARSVTPSNQFNMAN